MSLPIFTIKTKTKMKKNIVKILMLLLITSFYEKVFSQDYLNDKKAIFISGLFDLSNTTGSTNDQKDESSLSLASMTSANYFIHKNIFAGLGLSHNFNKTGVEKLNMTGIGPCIGYMLGDIDSKLYPYILVGFQNLFLMEETLKPTSYGGNYQNTGYGGYSPYGYGYSNPSAVSKTSTTNYNGYGIGFAIGVIFPIRKHLGLTAEISYMDMNIEDNDNNKLSANTLSFSIGIVGLLF